MASFFEEAKAYIGFNDADSEALKALREPLQPYIPGIVDHFYACIVEHPEAHAVIRGGEAQIERLKGTLRAWLESGLDGPHDVVYYERRARIGRMHVHIGLPQVYMFTAVNVMRLDIRHQIQSIYAGQPEARRVAEDAMDKLLDLELAIMLHTYREDSDQRLSRQARLVAIGQLAANIAHELRNPLGVIETSLYLLRRRLKDVPKVERYLDKIGAQVKTSGNIITDLLEMARDRSPQYTRADVKALIDEAQSEARIPPSVEIAVAVPEGLTAWVEGRLMIRALVNLIDNAVAIQVHGERPVSDPRLQIGAEQVEGEVRLWVKDNGPGFEKETLRRVFEPLVTTRSNGVGLGLALVQRVCQRHGGRATAENLPVGGACVSLWVPHEPPGVD